MLVHPYPTEKSMGELAHDVAYASAKHMVDNLSDSRVQDWLDGPFTKSVRRVRVGGKLDKIAAQDGVQVSGDVLVAYPAPYGELPKPLSASQLFKEELRQISYDDLNSAISVHVDARLGMSSGKVAAQVAHGVCAYILRNELDYVPAFSVLFEEEDFDAILASAPIQIKDAGLTELDGPTFTVAVSERS